MNPTPLQIWQAKSEEEKIEWLATKVMGWHEEQDEYCNGCRDWRNQKGERMAHKVVCSNDNWDRFDPLDDWNQWRQVEERVMENPPLFYEFMNDDRWNNEQGIPLANWYIQSDLPIRAQALFLAVSSTQS